MTDQTIKSTPPDKPAEKEHPREVVPVPELAITGAADNKLHQREQILQGLKTARLTRPDQQSFTIDRSSEGKGIEEDKRTKIVSSEKPGEVVQRTDASATHEPTQKQLEAATSQMLDSASAHFGHEKIDRLHINPGDLGSAVAASIVGPDVCQLLGAEATKQLGRRMIVFGVAPAFGALERAHEDLQNHPLDVGIRSFQNMSAGAVTSALLEMVHPVIGAIALTGGTAALIKDQLHSPENAARNHYLQEIDKQLNHASDRDLLALANHSRDLLSGDIYNGAFTAATGLVGMPGGGAIKEELPHTLNALLDKDILKTNISHISEEAFKGLQNLLPGHEAVTPDGTRIRLGQNGEPLGQDNVLFAWGKPTVMADLRRADEITSLIQKSDSDTVLGNKLQKLSAATDALQNLAEKEFVNRSIDEAPTMQDALKMTIPMQRSMQILNARIDVIRREVFAPAAQTEMKSIRLKPEGERTTAEVSKLADYELKQGFLEHTIKGTLKKNFGWDGVSRGFLDTPKSKNTGDVVQSNMSNYITDLVTKGRNDPEVNAIFEARGLSAKMLDDFVGLVCPKESAADHIGMDYMLVNKKTGQFYPIDITASATLPEGRTVSSFNSEGSMRFAGDKSVPSDRERFVIGSTERELLTRNGFVQTANVIADMLSKSKGLGMFETPPPSSRVENRSWMEKLMEMNVFRESLNRKMMTDWGKHIPNSMDHVFDPRNR